MKGFMNIKVETKDCGEKIGMNVQVDCKLRDANPIERFGLIKAIGESIKMDKEDWAMFLAWMMVANHDDDHGVSIDMSGLRGLEEDE